MRRSVWLSLLLLSPMAAFALGEATDVHGPFPYYYTGYYQYGSSPYVVVPSGRSADSSFANVSGPSYGVGRSTSISQRRPWSMGYISDGFHGRYYF